MPDEVVTTPFGKFLVNPDDCIGGTLKAGTLWDGPGFLQVIFKEHYQPGTTVIDVGANVGSFTIYAAAMGAWRVVAVEPIPKTLRYLRASLDLNQVTCAASVVVLPVAAYASHGDVVSLDWSPKNLGGAAVIPYVGDAGVCGLLPGAPLDLYQHLFGRRVSLVKIDAQGCDGAVILGLAQTIQRDHPAIVFEWEAELAAVHGLSLWAVHQRLESWGYQVHEWPSQPNNYLAVWKGEGA